MNDQDQAQRLAAWLDDPAEPPEDLDAEVLAAVSLLRPDLAPAARVSLDDILGSVKEGPFAARAAALGASPPQTTGEGHGFPVRAESSTGTGSTPLREAAPERGTLTPFPSRGTPRVASEPVGRVSPATTRRPRWLYPFIGVAFAAAAATSIVLPLIGDQVTDTFSHVALEGSPAAAPPPTTSAPDQALPEMAAGPVPTAEIISGGASPSAPPSGGLVGDGRAAAPVTDVPTPQADVLEKSTDAAPAEEVQTVVTTPTASVVGGSATGGTIAEAASDEARREGGAAASWAAPSDATVADATVAAPARSYAAEGYDDVAADEELADLDKGSATKTEKESARKRDTAGKAKAAEPVLAEDEPAQAPVAPAPTTAAATRSTVTTGSSALSSRASAIPLDYNPGWYRAYADLVPIYDAAAQDEAQARFADAVARYRPLFTDGRVDVAQDASWRGARDQMSQGDYSGALATIEAALRRGGGTSVYRVHLLVLKGDILNAQGRGADAARAWAEAATINRGR